MFNLTPNPNVAMTNTELPISKMIDDEVINVECKTSWNTLMEKVKSLELQQQAKANARCVEVLEEMKKVQEEELQGKELTDF